MATPDTHNLLIKSDMNLFHDPPPRHIRKRYYNKHKEYDDGSVLVKRLCFPKKTKKNLNINIKIQVTSLKNYTTIQRKVGTFDHI